ncbi:DUF3649 domain-containing protein, partial [Stenotrophomonas maltophilia]
MGHAGRHAQGARGPRTRSIPSPTFRNAVDRSPTPPAPAP